MGVIRSVPMTREEIVSGVDEPFDRHITEEILRLFEEYGCAYCASATNPERIYCYVKKSKETLIINRHSYPDVEPDRCFTMQLRITSPESYASLGALSERVRGQMLAGAACKAPHCVNCGKELRFSWEGREYRKCHMLCCNFWLKHLAPEDESSVLFLVREELKMKKRAAK